MQKITGEINIPKYRVEDIKQKSENILEFEKELKNTLSQEITEILQTILVGTIFLKASDIHIEPKEDQAKIRARIDGVLQDILIFDTKVYRALLSRIKLLSSVKLNITDRPQDGRFSIILEGLSLIEIRMSILPTEYGESIVLRILNPKSLIELESLNLRKELLELFKKEIEKPNGLIIVTGPTGSGKTTTLYAFLKRLQNPEIKIITIEDPIEYHLKGLIQTQTAPKQGYTFASGLKSIMRQDPDVILVGEIRDFETVSTALQAALTGHLVLTTLHTNDAAGSIARLQSLGEELVNIAPAINMVIAQRLIRKVCEKCCQLLPASPQVIEKIKKTMENIPPQLKSSLLSTKEEIKIPQIKKCQECNFTGFRGRVGILEALLVDEEMEKFILTSPSISALKEFAVKKGMITMRQDGLIKVLEGITTIEEVERVMGKQ